MNKGDICIELRRKSMLFHMHQSLYRFNDELLKHAEILKLEENMSSHLLLILGYLKVRYGL